VQSYLDSKITNLFFFVTSDKNFISVRDKLTDMDFQLVRLSLFCPENDKLPDFDGFVDFIKTPESLDKPKKIVIVGLGEYLLLRGEDEITKTLHLLKYLNVGTNKVVLLLRGVSQYIDKLTSDPRFDERRFIKETDVVTNLSITLVPATFEISQLKGLKSLLSALENGKDGSILVSTKVNLNDSVLTIREIENSYDGIVSILPYFNIPPSCGNEKQWNQLLDDLCRNNNNLEQVFEEYGFRENLEIDFYQRVTCSDFKKWLYFIALKKKSESLHNSYLRYVLEKTDCFKDFKSNVLSIITEIPLKNKNFKTLYSDRKKLLRDFPREDIMNFVNLNRKNPLESIYRLTDNTDYERKEIIYWISQNGIVPELANIYPALSAYLEDYNFQCDGLSNRFTEYFQAYKRQKLTNKLEDSFLLEVDKLAEIRLYNRLKSRNEVLDSIEKNNSYLFWLDALGVEYLSFISDISRKHDLSIKIHIARAELPTITSINRDFYDDWPGDNKGTSKELDKIKHDKSMGYDYTENTFPIHLVQELGVIEKEIKKASAELHSHKYERYIIVSDHGASRLAVLRKKEEKYETDTKGEHSGRCCKLIPTYDLPFATQSNGYTILADYGRFKGSRAASVEVHGGASLEEVVIPIIELSLKNSHVTVEIVEKELTVDYKHGATITLFVNIPLKQNPTLFIGSKQYKMVKSDDHHYSSHLQDLKKAGQYEAMVYVGDDLIGRVNFVTRSKSAQVNSDFDDSF
jgi:hypothetical protein